MNPQNQDVTTTTAEHSSDQLTTAAASRRKFLVRASAASLPVIASIQSGSAWGCVDLKCTPGTAALSTSGSAVASAVANKVANYPTRPDWKSVDFIIKVISDDFDSWLKLDYQDKRYFEYINSNGQKVSASNIANQLDWFNIAKVTTFYKNKSSTPYERTRDGRKIGVRVPAVYKNVVVKTNTSLQKLFDYAMSGSLSTTAIETHTYRFVIAALVGAIWERHPEYEYYYGKRPYCYPEPDQIVNKFKSLTTVQKADMNTLFEYYFQGTVNGKIPG